MTTDVTFPREGEPAAANPPPGPRGAYRTDGMTLAVVAPLEAYAGTAPTMRDHAALARRAERSGFAQLWVRDIPLLDREFGDAGQTFDSFTYLGYLAGITDSIALGAASTVLPLHHPVDVAKAAASMDRLSGGRFVLGVATGDRPSEFPAFGRDHEQRGHDFRVAVDMIRRLHAEEAPEILSPFGQMAGLDLLPKPTGGRLPIFATGMCRQRLEWIAANADGWIYYTLPIQQQTENIAAWRAATAPRGEAGWKPFHQSTYLDLDDDPYRAPVEIEQGLRVGREPLLAVLAEWQKTGVDQVMLNFRRSRRPVAEVLEELGEYVTPEFPAGPGD